MIRTSGPNHKTFNRGDPAAVDFTESDLSVNGAWTDLDLSGIIPVGTTSVVLHLAMDASAAGRYLSFRTKGNTNDNNISRMTIIATGISLGHRADLTIPTEGQQTIQYYKSAALFCTITVKEWSK